VFALLGAAFPAWLLGGAYLRDRDAALNRARDFAIEGPPCPSLTHDQFGALGLKAEKGVNYEDVVFYRQFGHMDCTSLRYGGGWSRRAYPVCQFTSPGAIRVTTREGDWYFAPGFGRPATVATPNGQPRCVLASNFTNTPK
jgi:hypothetical protein